uniref:PiggyBac transposable element-derived protein domain-containing protein n=1 Tax=Dicentrarchus labrax TaxID=13489 RepID=A0A8P4G9Y2_DICLA
MVVFHSLPQGNIAQLDHFCLNKNILMDGDVQGCIVITIINFFCFTIYYYSQEMYAQTFYGCKEDDRAVRLIPSDSEDSELEESDSEEEWTQESDGLSDDNESVDEEENQIGDDASEEDVPHLPRRTSHSANITDYPEWQASLPKSDNIMSPYEYLKMFFSEDLLEVVVEQSNLYAIQCDTNKPLNITTKELEQFMGTAVYMSLFGLPGTRMFWNKATRVSQVADTMALNRWEFIKKSLHFNDNQVRQGENVDLLHKIRPLVTHLTSKLQTIPMGEKLAVDEQMVLFKGRNRLKQYLPSKPKKWGYKILVLAGSDGVPHNFEIYTGRVV